MHVQGVPGIKTGPLRALGEQDLLQGDGEAPPVVLRHLAAYRHRLLQVPVRDAQAEKSSHAREDQGCCRSSPRSACRLHVIVSMSGFERPLEFLKIYD